MDEVRASLGPEVTLVGVIGSPVAHSLSPVLHEAAFDALGLSGRWRSFAFEVPAGQAPSALETMRRADVRGLSVTMPHKESVASLVDVRSETARRLEAVNCVRHADRELMGVNTDGEGFVASLQRGAAFDPAQTRCVVVGAGGAARAVVLALAGAGARQVAVVNRTASRAATAAELAGAAGAVIDPDRPQSLAESVAAADLVVNATPIGMVGHADSDGGRWLVPSELLRRGQVVADLVYAPRPTPWLAAAAEAGATTLDGLGMLVHQAAAQVTWWTGTSAPVEAMWQAAESAAER
jgi:shikimate dehydrogenase